MTWVPASEIEGEELYAAMCEQGVLVALIQAPWQFPFEVQTLDPTLFEWRAHREIASAIRRLAGQQRYPHYRRVRRHLRTQAAIEVLDALSIVGAAYGDVAGLIGELQRLRRVTRDREPGASAARLSVLSPAIRGTRKRVNEASVIELVPKPDSSAQGSL